MISIGFVRRYLPWDDEFDLVVASAPFAVNIVGPALVEHQGTPPYSIRAPQKRWPILRGERSGRRLQMRLCKRR